MLWLTFILGKNFRSPEAKLFPKPFINKIESSFFIGFCFRPRFEIRPKFLFWRQKLETCFFILMISFATFLALNSHYVFTSVPLSFSPSLSLPPPLSLSRNFILLTYPSHIHIPWCYLNFDRWHSFIISSPAKISFVFVPPLNFEPRTSLSNVSVLTAKLRFSLLSWPISLFLEAVIDLLGHFRATSGYECLLYLRCWTFWPS